MNAFWQLVRYLSSGITATLTHIALLYAMAEFAGLWYITATSIAFVCSFCVSFSLQKWWTFRDTDTTEVGTQAIVYFLIGVINLCLNGLLLYALVEYAELRYILAQIITSSLIALLSFFFYRSIFRR